MQKLVFASWWAMADMDKALKELEEQSVEILGKGGVPQGGVSIAFDPNAGFAGIQWRVAQAFLIDE